MRWELRAKHYLRVPGTEWEYEETSRETGKRMKKKFEVPCFLDPDNPGDQTPPGSGVLIVCHEGKGLRTDVVILDPPTPDMEPLDDEARELSDKLRGSWQHPIESLPGNFSQSLIQNFEKQMLEMMKGGYKLPHGQAVQASTQEFEALKAQVESLVEQNKLLMEKLSASDPLPPLEPVNEALVERRA